MKKISLNIILTCCLFQVNIYANNSSSPVETINKSEILKVLEEVYNTQKAAELEILKLQEEAQKKAEEENKNTTKVVELSPEELQEQKRNKEFYSKKSSLLKYVKDEIKYEIPAIIYIPSSEYSLIKIGHKQKIIISSKYLDSLINENANHPTKRKELFQKQRKLQNISNKSNSIDNIESETFGNSMGQMGMQSNMMDNMSTNNSSGTTTALTDLIELHHGLIYKNYKVIIQNDVLILKHLEEIMNGK